MLKKSKRYHAHLDFQGYDKQVTPASAGGLVNQRERSASQSLAPNRLRADPNKRSLLPGRITEKKSCHKFDNPTDAATRLKKKIHCVNHSELRNQP